MVVLNYILLKQTYEIDTADTDKCTCIYIYIYVCGSPGVEIEHYSVAYFAWITAFKTFYHGTSIKGRAHTHWVNSCVRIELDCQQETPLHCRSFTRVSVSGSSFHKRKKKDLGTAFRMSRLLVANVF